MKTCEKDLIVFLLYNECQIVDIVKTGPRKCEFEFGKESLPYLSEWQSFKPILVDLRRLLAAQQHFFTLIYDT